MKLPATGEEQQRGADRARAARRSGSWACAHDVLDALLIQDFAVLLGGKKPGQRTLTRTFLGANSRATFCVRLTTAAFEAE